MRKNTIIYANGILQLKNCSNVIFYGEIEKVENSKYICACNFYSILSDININNCVNMFACCIVTKTKEEIIKELKLDYWGQSFNIYGIKRMNIFQKIWNKIVSPIEDMVF